MLRDRQRDAPIGGGGEKRTLRLVARYADKCNVTGDVATLARKIAVLRGHCADVGRDPAERRSVATVVHLSEPASECVVCSGEKRARLPCAPDGVERLLQGPEYQR